MRPGGLYYMRIPLVSRLFGPTDPLFINIELGVMTKPLWTLLRGIPRVFIHRQNTQTPRRNPETPPCGALVFTKTRQENSHAGKNILIYVVQIVYLALKGMASLSVR